MKTLQNNKGFGIIGILVTLIIMMIITAASIPFLEGANLNNQAKAVVNTANSIIKAETQYQLATYSNNAQNSVKNPLFANISGLQAGLSVNGVNQTYLPSGLQRVNQGNNCVQQSIGTNLVNICLNDTHNGTFQLNTSGVPPAYQGMFTKDIYNGASAYNNGTIITPVNVNFSFSAYPAASTTNSTSAPSQTSPAAAPTQTAPTFSALESGYGDPNYVWYITDTSYYLNEYIGVCGQNVQLSPTQSATITITDGCSASPYLLSSSPIY
ncbi:MAG: pilus assembly FimT family protein [bacterium]